MEASKAKPLDGKRLLTVLEAGRLLGLSEFGVRRLLWSGSLPVVRVGRLVRIDIADLEAFVAENKSRLGRG